MVMSENTLLLKRRCDGCGAAPGQPCVTPFGATRPVPHVVRCGTVSTRIDHYTIREVEGRHVAFCRCPGHRAVGAWSRAELMAKLERSQ